MRKCIHHPHSSDESAIKCHNKTVGKRADRILERSGCLKSAKYYSVLYNPPLEVKVGKITIYYFRKGYLTNETQ